MLELLLYAYHNLAFSGASGSVAFWVLRLAQRHHSFYELSKQGVKTNMSQTEVTYENQKTYVTLPTRSL